VKVSFLYLLLRFELGEVGNGYQGGKDLKLT